MTKAHGYKLKAVQAALDTLTEPATAKQIAEIATRFYGKPVTIMSAGQMLRKESDNSRVVKIDRHGESNLWKPCHLTKRSDP